MLGEGHFATIIEHCQARLAKALNDAIGRNLIHSNPCQFVTKPRVVTQDDKAAIQTYGVISVP